MKRHPLRTAEIRWSSLCSLHSSSLLKINQSINQHNSNGQNATVWAPRCEMNIEETLVFISILNHTLLWFTPYPDVFSWVCGKFNSNSEAHCAESHRSHSASWIQYKILQITSEVSYCSITYLHLHVESMPQFWQAAVNVSAYGCESDALQAWLHLPDTATQRICQWRSHVSLFSYFKWLPDTEGSSHLSCLSRDFPPHESTLSSHWECNTETTANLSFVLKEKFRFLHIKPYNKDISDHIRCSTAFLWQMAQSWELELLADITTGWKWLKTMEDHVCSTNLLKNIHVLKDVKLAEC